MRLFVIHRRTLQVMKGLGNREMYVDLCCWLWFCVFNS